MTDPIKARIQSLCPDTRECVKSGCDMSNCWIENHKPPITLAVVLRAMISNRYYPKMETSGYSIVFFDSGNQNVLGIWNLSKDNYDDQTRETQLFIGSLLGVV